MGIEGFSFMGGAGENLGAFALVLDDWSKLETPELSQTSILMKAQKFDPIELERVTNDLLMKINSSPEFLYAFGTYSANTPHLYLDVDRVKAESMGVSVGSIFNNLFIYLGTLYVNDINLGSKINKVIMQADWQFRNQIDDIGNFRVSNNRGEQVPLKALINIREVIAPRAITRYNLYPTSELTRISGRLYICLVRSDLSTAAGRKSICNSNRCSKYFCIFISCCSI